MTSSEERTEVLLMLANKIMEGLNQDIIIEDLSYLFELIFIFLKYNFKSLAMISTLQYSQIY